MRIPEYFKDKELACRCGCSLMPPVESVYKLYALRLLWGKPMIINSAIRCATHNNRVGGAAGSTHLPPADRNHVSRDWGGCAFDIRVSEADRRPMEALAVQCGFRGIGEGKTFIHIDDAQRPQITRWIY